MAGKHTGIRKNTGLQGLYHPNPVLQLSATETFFFINTTKFMNANVVGICKLGCCEKIKIGIVASINKIKLPFDIGFNTL